MELDSSTLARLRRAVAASGLRPEDLAHTQSITPGEIEEILGGRRTTMSDGALRRIAQRLGTYPGLLLYERLTASERIGQRIRELREQRDLALRGSTGLSQGALASELGVSARSIERWEIGQTAPSRENIVAVAAYFGVSAAYIERGDTVSRRARLALRDHARGLAATAAILAGLVTVAALARSIHEHHQPSLATALEFQITDDGYTVEVRETRSGELRWRAVPGTTVDAHRLVWNGVEALLLTHGAVLRKMDTPAFEVREMESGRVLLSGGSVADTQPELRAAAGSYAPMVNYVVRSRSSHGYMNAFGDLDGDGADELFLLLANTLQVGPAHLLAFDTTGGRVLNYCFSGGIDDFLIDDLDGDGRDEVMISGWSSAPERRGPALVILDDAHASGMLADGHDEPACTPGDSSLASVTWPAFDDDFMGLLHGSRVRITELTSRRDPLGETLEIIASLAVDPGVPALIFLDASLRVTAIVPSDALRGFASQWPAGRAEAFFASFDGWAARASRRGTVPIDAPAPALLAGPAAPPENAARAAIATTGGPPDPTPVSNATAPATHAP